MEELHLNVVLKFNGEIEDMEHIKKQVESAIRNEIDTVGIVSDEDDAYTEDVVVLIDHI